MITKKIFLFVFFLLAGNSTWANGVGTVGNGGFGLLINGKPYVLDLVEAGAEQNPFFDPDVKADPDFLAELRKNLPQFPEIQQRLAQKISEVRRMSPIVAHAILHSFRLFDIHVVNENLVNVHDTDDSVIDYDPQMLVPLAVRTGTRVLINSKWWPQLDTDQKVALLFHESIYAFQNITKIRRITGHDANGNPQYTEMLGQESGPARAVTGFLFTANSKATGVEGLGRRIHDQNRLSNLMALSSHVVSVEKLAWGVVITTSQPVMLRSTGDSSGVTKDTTNLQIFNICRWSLEQGYSYTLYRKAVVFLTKNVNEGIDAQLKPAQVSNWWTCPGMLRSFRDSLP